MALVLKDRVKETSTTAGTGTITLAGAVAGFQSFSAVGNGNTTYYAIVDSTTGDWEVGIGTYTSSGTTLSRTTVLSSSNSGSLVPFAANPKDVFVTYPSEKSVYEDAAGVVVQTSFGAITATSAALTTGTVSTTPASNTDIANKQYVDGLVTQGISYHEPVYVESPNTTGNLNATYNNGASGVGATLTNAGTQIALTVDGILMTVGKRVLIYNQTNATQNGVYTVTTVGDGSTNWVLTRSADANTYGIRDPNALGYNDAFFVTNGNTGAGETYVCTTTGTITFGTTNITFAQISSAQVYTAGTGLNLSPATTFNISNTGVSASTYGSASAVPVFAVNAQGQITGVTNTNIAISGSAVSGNISGSAGSVANALTLGTYLTGGTYNGSAAVTATVDATSANTASKVVARDSSGNFSAGTITATLNGTATSTASATNLSGGAANQIAYQSATNTTAFATAPSASNQVLNWNGSAFTWSAGTISGVPLGSNLNSLTAGSYLTGTAYNGSAAQTWTVDATSANTASKVVARDASGNFSAGTITATLSGNATTATTASTLNGYTQDTAATANTIVLRDSGGDIYQRYGFAVHFNQSSSNTENPTIGGFWTNSTADNYNRKSSPAHVISQLGLLTTSNYNSYAPTLTGTGASGTWGINITGSAGSAGSVDYANLTNKAGGTGTYTTSGDYRAPIFYDSDNTAYYGNFAGTSNVNVVQFASGVLIGQASTSGTRNLLVQGSSGGDVGIYGLASNGGFGFQIYGDGGTNYGFLSSLWGGWDTRKTIGGALYLNNQSTYYYSTDTTYMYRVYGTGDIRSPIYYDNDNTAYYLDAANSASAGALSLNGGITFGIANPYLTASSYIIVPGGAYFNSGTVYITSNLQARGGVGNDSAAALVLTGGTSGYTEINGSTRSPIYYDISDTSFYVDPASASSQKTILIGYNSASPYVYDVASTGYLTFGTTSDPANYSIQTALESYSGNYSKLRFKWYTGIQYYASQAYGGHRFYDIDGTQYFGIGVGGNWSYSIYSHRAPIFYDLDNTGYYVDPASTSNLNNVQIVTLGVGTGGSGTTGEIRATANVTAYYSSDIKFKTNVRDIPNAIETVESIGGKLFDWNNEYIEEHGGEDGYFIQKEDFGVIAQDVLKVFPVAVRTRPDGSLAVDYEKLSALAFAAVAELSTRVKSLEARI